MCIKVQCISIYLITDMFVKHVHVATNFEILSDYNDYFVYFRSKSELLKTHHLFQIIHHSDFQGTRYV